MAKIKSTVHWRFFIQYKIENIKTFMKFCFSLNYLPQYFCCKSLLTILFRVTQISFREISSILYRSWTRLVWDANHQASNTQPKHNPPRLLNLNTLITKTDILFFKFQSVPSNFLANPFSDFYILWWWDFMH